MFSSATSHMPSTAYAYDNRRNNNTNTSRYPRSYHSSSSSSYASSGSGFNHPSPSSSATSTSSSVRTPPDLLLNGATLANGLNQKVKGASYLTNNTKQKVSIVDHHHQKDTSRTASSKDPNYLTITEIESRLKILSRASNLPLVSAELPSPPSSVGAGSLERGKGKEIVREYSTSPRMEPITTSQKRKALDNPSQSPEAQRPRRMSRATNDSSFSSLSSSFEPLSLPLVREWSREQYIETAEAYRHLGRQMKHRGDRRLRESSTQLTSPMNESFVAGLEQTDALLLYVYGFWCEDQGRGTCITENWNSIFGLLKYVYLRHEKNKVTVLAGLCRLLEASILRHAAGHEMRMLNHRLGKASSAVDSTSKSEMMELSTLMTKVVGDQERSNRLFAQAKQTVLNMNVLQQHYPALARFCELSMLSSTWTSSDQVNLATRLDPSYSTPANNPFPASHTNGWCWPLDVSSPFPMLVCFGRAILREAAKEAKVSFETESVV